MGDSRIKGSILQAAIHLFGKFGFEGVTTRGLAKTAHCMEGGIYRLYGNKARLYEEALATVVRATIDRMAKFALGLYTEAGAKMKKEDIIRAAVHCWYSSLSLDAAKLLQQVRLNDKQNKEQAEKTFEHVLAILEKTLESESQSARKEFDAKTRIESLIFALFQLKLSFAGSADKEKQEVDRFLGDWLLTVTVSNRPRVAGLS
jgi:AcrR family transcriptional regulator